MNSTNGTHRIERACLVVVGLATAWLMTVGMWEIAAPFGAGNGSILAEHGIVADNMVQYGIGFPVRTYAAAKPSVEAAYVNHPFGTYYLFALMRLVFGRHEWAIRLVPVLVSCAMPGLLFAVARRIYGVVPGALAALGWAVLPIALAFAQLPSFELFSLLGMLWITLAALRFEESQTRKRVVTLLVTLALALHADWLVLLFALLLFGAGMIAVAFGPNSKPDPARQRVLLQSLLLGALVIGGTLVGYLVSFHQAGLLAKWFGAAVAELNGNGAVFRDSIHQRRYWIEVMFTKPGILIGLLGAMIMVTRLFVTKRFRELYPPLLLIASVVHYVCFKHAADVQIYRPLPLAAQFCFGLAALALSVQELGRWLSRRRGLRLPEQRVAAVAFAMGGLAALLLLPDGLRTLEYCRNTDCQLNGDGKLSLRDHDKNEALSFLKSKIPSRAPVMVQSSMRHNESQDWSLERPTAVQGALGISMLASPRYVLVDARFAIATAAVWAVQSKSAMVGPYWLVDIESRPNELSVQGFEERRPTLLERLLVQAHDPIRHVVDDPYRTWEYRHHFAIRPNPEPAGLEQKGRERVLHNALIARGEPEKAAELRNRMEASLERSSARQFQGGLRLLGHRIVHGMVPRLEVYFLAPGAIGPDAFFKVNSRITQAPSVSFVVKDNKPKEYGVGFEIHPSLWQAGMIYVSEMEIRPRPGRERFVGIWTGSQRPRLSDGQEEILLFDR